MTYLDLLPMPSLSLPGWYKNKQSVGRGCSSVPEVLGSDRGCCVEETTLHDTHGTVTIALPREPCPFFSLDVFKLVPTSALAGSACRPLPEKEKAEAGALGFTETPGNGGPQPGTSRVREIRSCTEAAYKQGFSFKIVKYFKISFYVFEMEKD